MPLDRPEGSVPQSSNAQALPWLYLIVPRGSCGIQSSSSCQAWVALPTLSLWPGLVSLLKVALWFYTYSTPSWLPQNHKLFLTENLAVVPPYRSLT